MTTRNLLHVNLTRSGEYILKRRWRQWGLCHSDRETETAGGGGVGRVVLLLLLLPTILLGECEFLIMYIKEKEY